MPHRVRVLVADQNGDVLQRRLSHGEWSALDICRHLRDAIQVDGMRFKWIILQDDPFIVG